MSKESKYKINGYSKNPASLNYQKFLTYMGVRTAYDEAMRIAKREKNPEDLA